MDCLINPERGPLAEALASVPYPASDPAPALELLSLCPKAAPTPLVGAPELARAAGIASVEVKDERGRMGLGSFKALGAAYVIARDAAQAAPDDPVGALAGRTYVTASAGNHGLSVAAGARVFGARAVVYIARTVPESFAARLAEAGAEARRAGDDYQASMDAAEAAAAAEGWRLLSDSSWEGYVEIPHRLMEGYLALMEEAAAAVSRPPTHVFVQAGVGGLAGAVAAHVRATWGEGPRVIVVEPDAAPALRDSIRAGRPVSAAGPASIMGRLDCKTPSLIALKGLSRDADAFVVISDEEAAGVLPELARAGLATSASGGAGLAALLRAGPHRAALGLDADSRALAFVTEGPQA